MATGPSFEAGDPNVYFKACVLSLFESHASVLESPIYWVHFLGEPVFRCDIRVLQHGKLFLKVQLRSNNLDPEHLEEPTNPSHDN